METPKNGGMSGDAAIHLNGETPGMLFEAIGVAKKVVPAVDKYLKGKITVQDYVSVYREIFPDNPEIAEFLSQYFLRLESFYSEGILPEDVYSVMFFSEIKYCLNYIKQNKK